MIEDQVREDIAFIRHAVEEGRSYATARSPEMLIWGIALAIGYFGTYAFVRGWSPIRPGWLWAVCLGLPWVYTLRHRLPAFAQRCEKRPTAHALSMLWLGCAVFLTTLGVAAMWTGDDRQGWLCAVVAGVFGIAFFASASLANLGWLRWVAALWWLGELALFALRHRPEALPLAAVLMLLLFAGPGLLLTTRRGNA
ncbi:MAG: hypothetical protein JO104_05525 [Candidatus Eremiobacteraeota bacterium]|nr:hypothetical protein [Candidatus Eremiobacteraeota bacterium]